MFDNFKVGIDYGGTKIEGILMDDKGNEILRKRSTYEKNYKSGIETVRSLILEFDNIKIMLVFVFLVFLLRKQVW